MLQSLKRSLKLINKDSLDQAIWKVIKVESYEAPKVKHVQFIINVLLGQNEKIHAFLAFSRLLDLCTSNLFQNKWIYGLKFCILLHEAFQQNCAEFAKSLNANHVFQKLKQISQSQETIIFIHLTLYQNYICYLELFSENLELNCQFQLKQMLAMLKLLVKMHRELDLSLKKYSYVEITQFIIIKLMQDLKKYYTLTMKETQNEMSNIFIVSKEISLTKYKNYEDLIKLTRGIKKMCELSDEKIEVFHVDPEINRKIELHIQQLKQQKILESTNKLLFSKDIQEEEQKQVQTKEIELEKQNIQDQVKLNIETIIEIPHEIKFISLERSRQPGKRAIFGFKKNLNFRAQIQIDSDQDRILGIRKEVSRTARAQSNIKKNFYDTQSNPLSFLSLSQK